jgi:hypothetical protein
VVLSLTLRAEGECDVVDHVLLSADETTATAFHQQVAHVHAVALRGDLSSMAYERGRRARAEGLG